MGYVIGQPYKRVAGFKHGMPVYEMTTIVAVHPDKLVLANGTIIDYVPASPEKEPGKVLTAVVRSTR